jgi:hypothetical protein
MRTEGIARRKSSAPGDLYFLVLNVCPYNVGGRQTCNTMPWDLFNAFKLRSIFFWSSFATFPRSAFSFFSVFSISFVTFFSVNLIVAIEASFGIARSLNIDGWRGPLQLPGNWPYFAFIRNACA